MIRQEFGLGIDTIVKRNRQAKHNAKRLMGKLRKTLTQNICVKFLPVMFNIAFLSYFIVMCQTDKLEAEYFVRLLSITLPLHVLCVMIVICNLDELIGG